MARGSRSKQSKANAEVTADADYELVHARVAAVDVAKDFGVVCLRADDLVDAAGRRQSRTWTVQARTTDVLELAARLTSERVQKVTLESTGDYWRIWYYLLEAAGLSVQLVNARDVKNVPGRPKTDKQDAIWLAKLTERGMLRPSFVPPEQIRSLRDYTRLRATMVADRTRYWQRIEKLLEDALIKLSSVASSLTTASARDMIEALIAGERDPHTLAGKARGVMKHKHDALVEALTGRFDNHHAQLARLMLDKIDAFTTDIDTLTAAVEARLTEIDPPHHDHDHDHDNDGGGGAMMSLAERLDEIPGVGPATAQILIAELGVDPAVWPDADHLAAWAKLTPATIQSGNTNRTGSTGHGNPWLKAALGEAAAGAARTHTHLGAVYQRIVKRRGKRRALVAVARHILVIAYRLMSDPHARYLELGPDYVTRRTDTARRVRHHIAQLETLGYKAVLAPVA